MYNIIFDFTFYTGFDQEVYMKLVRKSTIAFMIFCLPLIGFTQTADEFIARAEGFNQAGNSAQAAKVMEEAVQKFPENSSVHSYLGKYLGTQAFMTKNNMEAGRLVGMAFEQLDQAVALDANNPVARFHRGLLSIKMPAFMNKLDAGIADLLLVIKTDQQASGNIPREMITATYDFLGEAYQQNHEKEKSTAAWQKVIEIVPGTALAQKATENIAALNKPESTASLNLGKYTDKTIDEFNQALSKEPDNAELLIVLGKAHLAAGNYEKAAEVLRKAIHSDSTKVEAYKLLMQSIGEIANQGYDKRIYDDTNFRTNLAFEMVKIADEAVRIAPDDPELKLIRGRIGVLMPFFVDKLEQAMADLNSVRNSNAAEELKAEAIYWLGIAYQKKATTSWIEVIGTYSSTPASKLALESMRPALEHFDEVKYKKPFIVIDFLLGFRDELPPQTAVWIEDYNGKFVKTVYVSGFSGFAKEKQANLLKWSQSSQFKDVDGVTGASITLGQHIYVWDLKDWQGLKVKPGEYLVKIEVMYWPSMEYECAAAPVKIGKKGEKVLFKEGKLIPYAELKYFSD
jgi:tetratricopeptide (TPR) repeat protein